MICANKSENKYKNKFAYNKNSPYTCNVISDNEIMWIVKIYCIDLYEEFTNEIDALVASLEYDQDLVEVICIN